MLVHQHQKQHYLFSLNFFLFILLLYFLYCGKINFLNGEGDGLFNSDFELEKSLKGKFREEFLRISKLIKKQYKHDAYETFCKNGVK